MALTDNLTAWWTLNELSGTRNDSVGSNDLTPNNAPGALFARKTYGTDFERSSTQSLSITDNPDLSPGDTDFTFAAWVKAESFITGGGNANTILSKDNGSVWEYDLYYDASTDRFAFYVENGGSSASVVANNLGAPSVGTWYLVVAWHDATNNQIGIQVNNGTANTGSYSGGVADTGHPFRIGADGQPQCWDGLIDEVGYWKQALDSTERTALWNTGAGLSYENVIGTDTNSTVYAHNGTGAQGYESWPGVTALSDTTLYAVVADGSAHAAEDFVVKGFTSTDGGDTWGSMVTVADELGGDVACYNPIVWRDPVGGALLCSYSRYDGIGDDIIETKLKRSIDDGASWSAWGTVSVLSGYDWIIMHGTITRVGVDLYVCGYGQVTATGFWNSVLLYSSDGGQTWGGVGVIASGDGSHQYSEADAAFLSGSDWYAVVRDDTTGNMSVTTSSNGGATWAGLTTFGGETVPTSPRIYKVSATQLYIILGRRTSTPIAVRIWETPASTSVFYGPNDLVAQATGIDVSDFGYASPVNVGGELKFAYYAPTGGANETSVLFDTTWLSVPPINFDTDWFLMSSLGESLAPDGGTTAAINTTGANFIVLILSVYSSTSTPVFLTPTDNKGNTYTGVVQVDDDITGGASGSLKLWICASPTVGTGHTFTATGTGNYPTICVQAWAGANATPYIGFGVVNEGNAVTSLAASAGGGTGLPEDWLLAAGYGHFSAFDLTSAVGAALAVTISDNVNGTVSDSAGGMVYVVADATQLSQQVTWNWSGTIGTALSVMARFAPASAGGGTYPGYISPFGWN